MDYKLAARRGIGFVKRNFPTILTGVGLGGLVITAFLSGKAALKADEKLKELEKEKGAPLDTKEKIEYLYPYYIPAVGAGLMTAGCFIGANHQNIRQIAAITAVAKTTGEKVFEGRQAVEEVFGAKGLRKVDEKINENNAVRYFQNISHVYETGKGHVLCCDGFLTGLLFYASREWVRKCVNDYNLELVNGKDQSWADFLMLVVPDIDPSIIPDAAYLWGYNLDIKRQLLEIVEDSFLTYDSPEPGYIFKVRELPLLNYDQYL